VSNASGKIVIIAILTVGIAAAAASWAFRYEATHRAVEFWGPTTAQMVRDAPDVSIVQQPFTNLTVDRAKSDVEKAQANSAAIDISQAHGLVHLRNALLEDRSFEWPTPGGLDNAGIDSDPNYWLLTFHDPSTNQSELISFNNNCTLAFRWTRNADKETYRIEPISTKPIAPGLVEFFSEASSVKSDNAQ
jgi:hypothetical protein